MKNMNDSYIYNPYKEKLLCSALEKGDRTEAIAITNSVLDDVANCGIQSKELLKIVCFNMVGTMLRVADKFLFPSDEIVGKIDDIDIAVKTFDIAGIKLLFELISEYVCNNSNAKGSASVVEAAAQYITKNFHNSSLSIPVIAKQFNIHPNYLSNIFKVNTNSTIMEYLSQIRITAAKKLLAESSLSIKEISLRVGYSNPHTFTRIFKKIEGVTPSNFRKI